MRLSRGPFDLAVRETIERDPALSLALLPMLQARHMLFETFLERDRRVKRADQERSAPTSGSTHAASSPALEAGVIVDRGFEA